MKNNQNKQNQKNKNCGKGCGKNCGNHENKARSNEENE